MTMADIPRSGVAPAPAPSRAEPMDVPVTPRNPGMPLDLEWLLVAPGGREVARHTHRLPARTAYASVGFALTHDAPPGRYRIMLQIEGVLVGERPFVLETDGT